MLEYNRNQLEAKGIQLATNKEQLHKYSLRVEDRDTKIASLKDTIRGLEKQLVSNVKSQLLEAEEVFSAQQKLPVVNGEASAKVYFIYSLHGVECHVHY